MVKRQIIIGLIVLALIGVIAGIGWTWNWKFWEKKGEIEKPQTEIQLKTEDKSDKVVTSTQSQIDISDWNIYKNEKYGFEIKYPPYSPKVKKTEYNKEANKYITTEVAIPQIEESDEKNYITIQLPFLQNSYFSSKKLIINIQPKEESCSLLDIGPNIERKTIYINGIKFIREKGTEYGAGHGEEIIRYTTFKRNQCIQLIFSLSYVSPSMFYSELPPPDSEELKEFYRQTEEKFRKELEIFDQMVSTFKSIK